MIGYIEGTAGTTWQQMNRGLVLFDTSALTSGATISAAVLSIFGSSKLDESSDTPNIDVVTTTPASNTSLTGTDFAQFGSVSQTGSPITYANWSTSAYNDFTFDATGRGNVSKIGISKFGFRNSNYDLAGSGPSYLANGKDQRLKGDYAETADTTSDPKLVVTYTTGGGAAATSPGWTKWW